MNFHGACRSCGRPIERKGSNRDSEIVYCSKRCRQRRIRPLDRELEAELLALLDSRSHGTICPSEVARRVGGETWRPLMELVRRAARRLANRGELQFLQRGRVVDGADSRGPVRFRRPRIH